MSSSFIVEPQEGVKKDDTLILMVNDDGVISVDQDTLQNLIINQSNATVSVVRLGQTKNDASEGNITLTVDPPQYAAPESNVPNSTGDSSTLVDPFMEMDPEALERLETALQSEEAKQILGENVTAMLDMLTAEEEVNSIKYSIELDHCYTSRLSPSQTKPADPLPDISSSEIDESLCADLNKSLNSSSISSNNTSALTSTKQKVLSMPPKIVKQPARPRRASNAMQPIANNQKSAGTNARSANTVEHSNNSQIKEDNDAEEDELFSSSESSDSEESFSDGDFGPKPFRRGVRARGGRRGLTTRGGSMSASRRRASSKQMDGDQVKRLDVEMAAAVTAMKNPEKEDKSDKHNHSRNKKQLKVLNAKKKDDTSVLSTSAGEPPPTPVEINVLQTTNQVKANLINANMCKGDMILTKVGQNRSNQKVMFIPKQIGANSNDVKNVSFKKQVTIPKGKLIISQNSKVPVTKEGKVLLSPMVVNTSNTQQQQKQQQPLVRQIVNPVEVKAESIQSPVQSQKTVHIVKSKPGEVKKERKKSDVISDSSIKVLNEAAKTMETKTIALKKVVKKEHRKLEPHVAETLGPALFSTPDIIRRVSGSGSEMKNLENTSTPTSSNIVNSNVTTETTAISPSESVSAAVSQLFEEPMDNSLNCSSINDSIMAKLDATDASMLSETLENDKLDASNSTSAKEVSQGMEQSDSSKHALSESGIEGDEHLLATLGVGSSKQLPNEEELLAEALLLQETLGVDLEHSGLVDPAPEISESILSSVEAAAPSISATPIKTEQPIVKTDVSENLILTTSTLTTSSPTVSSESGNKKDPKNPVQIIRGGRVITLPPIERPTTRSKRQQAKPETPSRIDQTPPETPKVDPLVIKTDRMRTPVSLKKQDMVYEMDDDDDEEEAEANSESEDDPNRLWCICRQPHNNRFMICCDMCQDWFHGKCVHVTKAMGEQMEQQGIEWVCPNCSKKKNEECKPPRVVLKKQKSISEAKPSSSLEPSKAMLSPNPNSLAGSKPVTNSGKNSGATTAGVTHCVVCKKEARKSSIYCSDACILAHAEVTTTKDKPSASPAKIPKTDTPKVKADARIIVFDKRTGKVLTGSNAPTAANLKTWLKEHPTYEVAKSKNLNTIQVGGKTLANIQTQGLKTNKMSPGTSPGQSKMVFSKVAGSKQTVLAPSVKKSPATSENQQGRSTPQNKPKQSLAHIKTPVSHLKQTTIKTVSAQQQQQTPQKPSATSTPKTIPVKKMYDQKPSTSQQKTPQQQPQQKTTQQQPQQKTQQPQQTQPTPPPKKSEPEPDMRSKVRENLAELLTTRLKDSDDITLSEEEVMDLAVQIELEMFKFFKDTGAKYKAKYRSLVFNIKDTKNLTLYRKIADKSLTPAAVVKLSPDDMASQELAEWREKETKHQLEMIKKNELDMMAIAKSLIVKTHKGEQIIENDKAIDSVDPKTPVQDIVTALNKGDTISSTVQGDDQKDDKKTLDVDKKKKDREKDRDREKRRDKSRDNGKKRRHSRDRDRSREKKSKKEGKHKDKDHDKSKDKKNEKKKDKKDKHKHSRSHSKNRHKDHKDKDKDKDKTLKKEDEKKVDTNTLGETKSIGEGLWRHIEDEITHNTLDGNDSDVSDREPSSTVNIKTPDINEELEREILETKTSEIPSTIWRGFVHMADVAKFFVTAQNVSGNAKDLIEVLPDTLDVVGRINPETVWDYIGKIKKNATKDILIVRFTATNDEEKIPYITLYSYLNSRNRLGVFSSSLSPNIKDFYIMPFSKDGKLPSVLLPLEGPDFEQDRQHLLLGIIVVHSRKKRPATGPPPLIPAPKMTKKDPLSGSFTSDASFTSSRMSMHDPKQNLSLSKIVPELSSKITLESSSSSDKMLVDDDDEPYSPGEPVEDDIEEDDNATSSFNTKESKSSSELQRKMEELSRQIEEEKQQIQHILGDAAATLPGLGCDPPGVEPEAYSPGDSRSFTPPPQGLPKLTPILEKVSDITIPPNLQEILANVKRQESSKVDSYLPPKPGATFLTTYKNTESYSSTYTKSASIKSSSDVQSSPRKETKSTLSSLSDYDLMKKAEEELAALAATEAAVAAAAAVAPLPPLPPIVPAPCVEPPPPGTSFASPHR